ncbi:hypothetical protein ES708_30334 [subsurface metagenome]
MSRRVFTKVLKADVIAPTMPMPMESPEEAITSWLVQEDIEVVAVELVIASSVPSENDGFAKCYAELSQTSKTKAEGLILGGVATEGWNTVPQGLAQTNCNVILPLPAGSVIPIKEEGYVYLNAVCIGKTAGVSKFQVIGIIYYTKRGA